MWFVRVRFMLTIALKMLIGNRASLIGAIFGVFLATLLITQQTAIFLGLVSRSYRIVSDIPAPDIWVVDPSTESDIKVRGMPEEYLQIVRSIPNIEWAEPINVMDIPLSTQSGVFHICQLFGIDDVTLIGAPQHMVEGSALDLRREDSVIIDIYSAKGSLAKVLPDGTKIPLKVGDSFEINHRRSLIVGLCKITQGFYPQPVIFTSTSNFKNFTSSPNLIQFIAAKTKPGSDVGEVLKKINSFSALNGLTRKQLAWRIAKSFLQTGILINFGLSVFLGLIIGFSISGLIFYMMVGNNIKYYALIKSMGGTQTMIMYMIMMQALIVGILGFIFGTAVSMLWGYATEETTLAFYFPWQLLLFTGFIALIICIFTAGLSIRKVFVVDPKMLLGT